jgi:DNA polymerase-3 subunit delta
VDYATFVKTAERGEAPPVALLHGTDTFLLEDAAARVTRGLFPEGADLSLLRETFDSRETDAESLVQSALVLPWGEGRRLVIARGVEGLKSGEALAAYVRSPNPTTVMLLLAGQTLAASHWLMSAMPPASIVPVLALTGRQLVAWLTTRASTDGFALAPDAAALLVELSGNDLVQLLGDVEKAALAGGPDNRRVGIAEVRAVVGEHRLRHIFELTRALEARDAGAALSVLERLLNAGEEPLGVLGMLAREVRALWLTSEQLRQGRREDDIARSLRRPPAAAAAVIARAGAMGPEGPARLLARCWDVERRLKLSGLARPELSLLITDLCEG